MRTSTVSAINYTSLSVVPDHLIVTNGHNGRFSQQTCLLTNGHGLNDKTVTNEQTTGKSIRGKQVDCHHQIAFTARTVTNNPDLT